MSITDVLDVPDAGAGCAADAAWLLRHRTLMDRGEHGWLTVLARFDGSGAWALDGMASCATWLVGMLKMARPTAHDKVRVARQIALRPVVDAAMADGSISYSAARAITRVTGLSEDTDRALVNLAMAGTVADLERAVRHIELIADQDTPPPEERRGLRSHKGHSGGRIIIDLDNYETDEADAAFDAMLSLTAGSSAEDSGGPDEGDRPRRWSAAARADAFMELLRRARRGGDGDRDLPGGDWHLVHVIRQVDEHATLADGTPLRDATAEMIACDCSLVEHLIGPNGEPLALGRKQRTWSTAQRRAAKVRDRAHCRFPGCDNTFVDLHHHRWWEHQGPTDIANGFLICRRHHRLVHEQLYRVAGEANSTLSFQRPDGTPIADSPAPFVYQPTILAA